MANRFLTSSMMAISAGLLTVGSFSPAFAAVPTHENGTLSVGMDITYPPFEYYEGDEVKGFDADLSRLLAKQLGTKVAFKDVKLANLILGLKGNRFDTIISGMYIRPERLRLTQAIPYAKTGAAIISRADADPAPATAKDLCGLRVGLQQGTSWVTELQSLSDSYCKTNDKGAITIQEFSSAPDASQALMSHNVDAQLEIRGAAERIAERTRGRLKVTSDDLVYPQTLGIFVAKNNQSLHDALASALDKLRANGELDKLLKQYGLQPAATD